MTEHTNPEPEAQQEAQVTPIEKARTKRARGKRPAVVVADAPVEQETPSSADPAPETTTEDDSSSSAPVQDDAAAPSHVVADAPAAPEATEAADPAQETTTDDGSPVSVEVPDAEFSFRADNGGKRTVRASTVLAIAAGRSMPDPKNPKRKLRGSLVHVQRAGGKVSTIESVDNPDELRAKMAELGFEVADTYKHRVETAADKRSKRMAERDAARAARPARERAPRAGAVTVEAMAEFVTEQLKKNPDLTQTKLIHAARNAGMKCTREAIIAAIKHAGATPGKGRKAAAQEDDSSAVA